MIPTLPDAALGALEAPEPPGFTRVRRVMAGAARLPDDAARKRVAGTLRRAIHASAFERATLNPAISALSRLSRLADLQSLIGKTDLMERDRSEASLEIDRAAMRILWAERLVETVLESEARPEARAAALLSLVARGAVPAGAASRALLEPAKALLLSDDARAAIIASSDLRTQLMDLLAAAEAGGLHGDSAKTAA